MRDSALAAVVAGTLAFAVPSPAVAQTPAPRRVVHAPQQSTRPLDEVATGRTCGLFAADDPTIPGGEVLTGWIWGGPLTATAPGATISMACTVQVGSANSSHSGADSATASSSSSLQTTTLPKTLISFYAPEGQPIYVCTQITVNGVTYYWDAVWLSWSTSSAAHCLEAIDQAVPPVDDLPVCQVFAELWWLSIPGILEFDRSDGDVTLIGEAFWECPPYDW